MFFFLDDDPNKTPYECLSDLCTFLVISDEMQGAPLDTFLRTINSTMQKGVGDGDVVVMATRALALLLDKFHQSLTRFSKKSGSMDLKKCFHTIFSVVRGKQGNLRHERTTVRELHEEILKCLSLASNSRALSGFVPSIEEQLNFCLGVLDGSKWTACRVLRHCIDLMRGDGLIDGSNHHVVEQLLHHHLSLLCDLDIDYEWDELLRTIVEGIVTYRVWGKSQTGGIEIRKKRPRRNNTSTSTSTPRAAVVSSTLSGRVTSTSVAEGLLAIGERICSSDTAETRVQLTVACLASLMEVSLVNRLPPAVRVRALGWLARLLEGGSARVASYSNPFARSRCGPRTEASPLTNTQQALANLQWLVPAASVSALVLVAKLCGADLNFHGEYVWGWRGEGGEYYPYSRGMRRRLTAMFLAAERVPQLVHQRHMIDLRAMTDTNILTRTVARIHFQPIPYLMPFLQRPFVVPTGAHLIGSGLASALLAAVRPMAFGYTNTAALARAVRLAVVCNGPPRSDEDTVSALRAATTMMESYNDAENGYYSGSNPDERESDTGEDVERKRKRAKAERGGNHHTMPRSGVRSRGMRTRRERAAAEGDHKGSTRWRSAASSLSATLLSRDARWAAALRDAGLTASSSTTKTADGVVSAAVSPSDLCRFLRCAAPSSLLAYFEALDPDAALPPFFADACAAAAADAPSAGRLRAAAEALALREVQHRCEKTRTRPLGAITAAASAPVGVCTPRSPDGATLCDKGHPLRVHFSVNWRCDVCHGTSAFGSLACRICDYDLCPDCANARLSRLDLSATATVGDTARAWRDCLARVSVTESKSADSASVHGVLFSSRGVFPAATPAAVLRATDVHFADAFGACRCGITAPSRIAPTREWPLRENAMGYLLRSFFRGAAAMEPAIVDALESSAADIFLRGAAGVPLRVGRVMSDVAPHLSLQFKRDTAHFLAVGCRRFGLYALQDAAVSVRGAVSGDIESNGLATKVAVRRETTAMTHILWDAFFQYPTLRNKVEFNFQDEEGTGEGPTQELYAEVSHRYATLSKMWHTRDDGARVAFPTTREVCREEFFVLGACCARAFVDGYTMDLPLLPCVWSLVRATGASAAWDALREMDPALSASFEAVRRASPAELDAMGLEDDAGNALTVESAKSYIAHRIEERLASALANLRWFALGLATAVDLSCFWFLTDAELSAVLCGAGREDDDTPLFNAPQLRAVVVEAHGYSPGSREVGWLVGLIGGEFTRQQQKYFLEFLTGSQRLPLNGLQGLGRKITVVRKEMEGKGEQTLPSCNTCFLYLKLPPYSSREIMKERLIMSVTEGRKNFSLS